MPQQRRNAREAQKGEVPNVESGCIIMASGAASRFGSNKLLAALDGVPLIEHVIRATEGLFAQRVVVTRSADVAAVCRALGARAVLHDKPLRSDTVRLGMQALGCDGGAQQRTTASLAEPMASSTQTIGHDGTAHPVAQPSIGCDTVTFFQADQPLISANSIAALLSAADRDPQAIWRTNFAGTPGAPVLFPAWTFDELLRLPAGKGGGYVARAHQDRVHCIEVASTWELFDVDTPDDLRILQQHLNSCR